MADYASKGTEELRKLAGAKAKAIGEHLPKRQNWNKARCLAYLVDWQPTEAAADTGATDIPGDDGLTMEFSSFPHKRNSMATPLIMSQETFIKTLARHHVRPKKDGKLFAPATFNGSRGNGNFIAASGLCLDFDEGQPTVEQVLELFPRTLAAFYSTHSHCWKSKAKKVDGVLVPADTTYTPENPRFRVVIPLLRPVNADEHLRLILGVKSIIPPVLMDCLDPTCFDRARAHYLPSCLPGHEGYAFADHQDGEPLNVERFMLLGAAVAPVEATMQREPELTPLRTFEFIDLSSGEDINLNAWAAQNPTFDIMAAVGAQYRRGNPKGGKQHIVCPFEEQHTDQGDDRATFVANASQPQFNAWDVHCCHAHCTERDRLEYLLVMLEKGWISIDHLQTAQTIEPPPLEMKRPPYMNYRAHEFVAELVKQPLDPEEFRIHLHLMHAACAVHDGTLPDDSWTIARILGIPEDHWLRHRTTLIRSGWQVVEGCRIYNPITRREYRASQAALMRKTAGGTAGGLMAQANRRDREAYLKDT